MSYEGLLHRGVATPQSFSSTTSTPLTHSTISEVSLQVPPSLYIHSVKVDQKAVRGSGSYGTVFVASWHNSKVAAKRLHAIFFDRLNTADAKTGILRSFAREVNMLIQLKHPNIVHFYGLYTTSPGYDLNPDTYLVQELMHCALDVRLRQSPPLTFRNVVDISLDVVSGLRYLHERSEPIIHRDLASKNILLSSVGTAKIADLGVAKILDENQGTPQSRLPGTELYMPPEVKIEGMAYDTKVDIYSFGVVILELAIGRDAKANETFRVSASNRIVLTPETERRKEDFDTLGHHPLRSVILSCLARREERPSAKHVNELLKAFCTSSVYQNCPTIPVILLSSSEHGRSNSFDRQHLEEKIQRLQLEIECLQAKLTLQRQHSNEFQLDQLMTENASLQSLLSKKDAQISQLKDALKCKHKEDTGFEKQAATLLEENKLLRQKLRENGPMSLPDQLPSFTSEKESSLRSDISQSADQLNCLSITSNSSESQESTELAKLKKKLEKYQNANIEMDQKLKEARLQLQKHDGRAELSYKLELEQVRAECRQLRSQLDTSLRENSYLQSQLSAALSRRF